MRIKKSQLDTKSEKNRTTDVSKKAKSQSKLSSIPRSKSQSNIKEKKNDEKTNKMLNRKTKRKIEKVEEKSEKIQKNQKSKSISKTKIPQKSKSTVKQPARVSRSVSVKNGAKKEKITEKINSKRREIESEDEESQEIQPKKRGQKSSEKKSQVKSLKITKSPNKSILKKREVIIKQEEYSESSEEIIVEESQSESESESEVYSDEQPKKKTPNKIKTPIKTSKKTPTKKDKTSQLSSEISLSTLSSDMYLNKKENDLIIDCCIQCNSRNVIRAANTSNMTLLKKCIESKSEISDLNVYWSEEAGMNAFELAVKNGDKKFLVELISYFVDKKHKENRKGRVAKPRSKLFKIGSGSNSIKTFGRRIRKVNMTRGGKLGNNAFVDDLKPAADWRTLLVLALFKYPEHTKLFLPYLNKVKFSEEQISTQRVKFNPTNIKNLELNIYQALNQGNGPLASFFISLLRNPDVFGFNDLHKQCLIETDIEVKHKVSVNKKSRLSFTPVHFASVNPNGKVIEKLLKDGGDLNFNDIYFKKPIHYAAVCKSDEPLKILVSKGANINEVDKTRFNPLLYAAKAGRVKNIKFLLDKGVNVNYKPYAGANSAIHWAALMGHIDVVEHLLDFKPDLIEFPGADRMTPLHCAAKAGHEEIVELLLERGAKVNSKDKLKRTPFLLACKSGFPRILAILMNYQADYECADNSGNTPLHYACAYGWMENVKILLQAETNINAHNSWKTTPLELAVLKNHFGIVRYLLDKETVDVNTVFDAGNTILLHSLKNINPRTFSEIKFLIDEKKCNANATNFFKKNTKHNESKFYIHNYVKNFVPSFGSGNKNLKMREKYIKDNKEKLTNDYKYLLESIVELLVTNGCDINAVDSNGYSPLTAGDYDNIFIEIMLKYDPNLLVVNKRGFNILHQSSNDLDKEEKRKFLFKILSKIKNSNYPDLAKFMNTTSNEGFTPLLEFAYYYSKNIFSIYNNVLTEQTEKFYKSKPKLNKKKRAELTEDDRKEIKNITLNKFLDVLNNEVAEIFAQLLEMGANPHDLIVQMKKRKKDDKKKSKPLRHVHNNFRYKYNQPQKNKKQDKDLLKKIGENYYEKYGNTNILMFLMTFPIPSLIKTLVENYKLDINHKDVFSNNCLFYLLQNHEYINQINPESFSFTFDYLVNSGINVNHQDVVGNSAFTLCSRLWLPQQLKRLQSAGADVNLQNDKGENALLYYVKERNFKRVKYLLENFPEININIQDKEGKTALHYIMLQDEAGSDSDFSLLSLLLSKKVDPNIPDKLGRTPIFYLFIKNEEYNLSEIDPIASLCFLLEMKNINLNHQDMFGNTVVFYAVQRCSFISLSSLLAKGVDIRIKNKEGNSAFTFSFLMKGRHLAELKTSLDEKVFPLIERKSKEDKDSKDNSDEDFDEDEDEEEEENESNSEDEDEEEEDNNDDNYDDDSDETNDIYDNFGNDNQDDNDEDDKDEDNEEEEEEDECSTSGLISFVSKENGLTFPPLDSTIFKTNYDAGNYFDKSVSIFGTYKAKESKKNIKKSNSSEKDDDDDYDEHNEMSQSDNNDNDEDNEMSQSGNNDDNHEDDEMSQSGSCDSGSNKSDNDYNVHTIKKNPKEGVSLFTACICNDQQGLIYYLLNSGYDLVLALHEAFKEKKFNLALLLINRCTDDSKLHSINNKGESLFHSFISNAKSAVISKKESKKIFEILVSRGVKLDCFDKKGYLPIHYAAKNHRKDIIKSIYEIFPTMVNIRTLKEGYTPFVCTFLEESEIKVHFKGVFETSNYLLNQMVESGDGESLKSISMMLDQGKNYKTTALNCLVKYYSSVLKEEDEKENNEEEIAIIPGVNLYGAPFKIAKPSIKIFPIKRKANFRPGLGKGLSGSINFNSSNNNLFSKKPSTLKKESIDSSSEVNDDYNDDESKSEEQKVKPCPLNLMQLLVNHGSNIMEKDSDGRDCIMWSAISNKTKLLDIILNDSDVFLSQVQYDTQDNSGKSFIHLIVQPLEEGTFQNTLLLEKAITAGFNYQLLDKQGMKPIDLAYLHKNEEIMKFLQNYDSTSEYVYKLKIESEVEMEIPHTHYNFEEDSRTYYDMMNEKEKESDALEVLIDPVAKLNQKTNELYRDDNGLLYDVSLTKVDLGRYMWGEYLFYKMQVIHDLSRNNFILWNRWGRIGEEGAYQRTPFSSAQEVAKEFNKIFKSKTGNEFQDSSNFVKKPKKYQLVKCEKPKRHQKDFLRKLKIHPELNCALPEEIKGLIKKFTNKAALYKVFENGQRRNNLLLISYLNDETLNKAKEHLEKIREAVITLDNIRKQTNAINHTVEEIEDKQSMMNLTNEEKVKLIGIIYENSNRYYELVQIFDGNSSSTDISPLNNLSKVNRELVNISNLTYVEKAVKILLGALLREKEVCPLDYCYLALDTEIKVLGKDTNQWKYISTYINNTKENLHLKISNIFSVNRRHEKSCELDNKYLLFHGSKEYNFMGIFSGGLKIAPVEADHTGAIYGKGIYFADMISKSYHYCHYRFSYNRNKKSYILVCEVALGKQYEVGFKNKFKDEKDLLSKGFNSLKALASRGPDMNKLLYLNDGSVLPIGEVVEYKYKENKQSKTSLGLGGLPSSAEYIVYKEDQVKIRYLLEVEEN